MPYMRLLMKIVEGKETPTEYWANTGNVAHWTSYTTYLKFKSAQEAKDWVFRKLESYDKESSASLFGINGPEKNRQIADLTPLYKLEGVFKIGAKAKPSRKRVERLGVSNPQGSSPNVDFHAKDLQDSNRVVTAETILRDYVPERQRKSVTVYMSYVPSELVPTPRLVEVEDAEEDEDENGGYEWGEFRKNATFPPLKLEVDRFGKVTIVDGNHRAHYWGECGFEYFPAWVIDFRPLKAGQLTEQILTATPWYGDKKPFTVYKNPSMDEYGKAMGDDHQVRAFVKGDDLYVWNAAAGIHAVVYEQLKLTDAIPLYMYGFIGEATEVMVTDCIERTKWANNKSKVASAIKNCGFLKNNFKRVLVDYYDADVVGDWKNLLSY
jgi:hypothetical protein